MYGYFNYWMNFYFLCWNRSTVYLFINLKKNFFLTYGSLKNHPENGTKSHDWKWYMIFQITKSLVTGFLIVLSTLILTFIIPFNNKISLKIIIPSSWFLRTLSLVNLELNTAKYITHTISVIIFYHGSFKNFQYSQAIIRSHVWQHTFCGTIKSVMMEQSCTWMEASEI